MKTKLLYVSLVSLGLIMSGCNAEEPAAATPAPSTGDGSQTAAGLAGSYQICDVFDNTVGATLNGKAFTFNVTIGSGGTYNWGMYVSDATSCATATNAGGNNLFTFHQSGTFTVDGTNTVPVAEATRVLLTPTSQTFTIYGASNTGAAATASQAFATWMNANCTGLSSNFTAGDSSRSMSGVSCTWAGGSYNFGNASANGTAVKNIMYNDGTVLVSGAGSNFLTWGASSYGTTFDGISANKY